MLEYHIYILEPPVVSTAAEDKYTVTGDTVTLQCAFSSTLPVNITWSKGDLQSLQITAITVNDRITISSSNNSGELIIRSATSDDNGLYTCVGMTIAGTAITAAEILVGSKSQFQLTLQLMTICYFFLCLVRLQYSFHGVSSLIYCMTKFVMLGIKY